MKATDFFQSKYLRKEDLSGPAVLTIAQVRGEMIDGDNGKEQKAVLQFTDARFKPMIVNKGNWITLAETYGDDSDHWHGKPVEVYVDPSVMYGGKRVGGLRVRVPSGGGLAPAWDFARAVTEAAPFGITRDSIVAAIKSKGGAGWNPARDTPMVQAMIRESQQSQASGNEQGFDDTVPAGATGEDIPF